MSEPYKGCILIDADALHKIYGEAFNAIHGRLELYEKTFGNIDDLKEVSRYKGEVIDVDLPDAPGGVRIEFQLPEGRKLFRVLPKKRLEAIGAAFPTAEVEYIL
ncbi:MAG: hypothetical protein QMD97_04770, partial [Candidatus Aenigmarchaeota archaeon]|nr:hypothetical protein [Candidatus Aenigmarchaeota archaeon]